MSKKKRNTQEKNQRVNRLMAYQKEIKRLQVKRRQINHARRG